MSNFENFLATWELIPSENKYEFGYPPKKGTYKISLVEDNTLRFDMEWVDNEDKRHSMFYLSEADGQMHEYENPSIAEFVKTTLLDEYKLESISYKDNIETSYSIREIIDDKSKLLVIQSGLLSDAKKFTNKSIYKKL